MIEKAIHITNLRNIKYFQENREYQRIYWGTEFCQNLIPRIKDTEKMLDFTERNNLKFTFITPFVTEKGLKKLEETFVYFKKRMKEPEIVVNDWGVLEYLHSEFKKYFSLALGRLLVRQQRDPAMQNVLEKQPVFAVKGKDGKIRIILHRPPSKSYQEGIRASYVNSPQIQSILSKFGVKRIELNNLIQGLNLTDLKLKKSLYVPYVNISTTRFCPMNSRYQRTYRINVCKKECQSYYNILRNHTIPKIIYNRGNTAFYKNPLKISAISKMEDIDRIVFQPELPF